MQSNSRFQRAVLKFDAKGALDRGKDADVVVMRRDSLEIVEVITS